MDLSLQGSQINLVSRYKPKAPIVNYPVVQRPGSASICGAKSRASPFLRRPQSADPKFSRGVHSFESFSDIGLSGKNKKFNSTSSSSLLKLLLDEPIRRPWLCRDSDEISDCSLGQKVSDISGDHLRKYSGSSVDGESRVLVEGRKKKTFLHKRGSTVRTRRPKLAVNTTSPKRYMINNEPPKMSQQTDNNWPNLAGRVSFATSGGFDIDLSDCDNDKQGNALDSTKKSVHFGKNSVSEYTKCPSENCSCSSTRSSSAASDLPCQHSVNKDDITKDTNPVIEEYKNAIKMDDNNVIVEKQNDFAEIMNNNNKTAVLEPYKQTNRNLMLGSNNCNNDIKVENVPADDEHRHNNPVINNYLKVAATPVIVRGKKSNVPKCASASTSKSRKRENSNLHEFQLDKIDSWMSLHEDNHCQDGIYQRNETPETEETSKSDDSASTYDEIVSVIKEIEEDKVKGNLAQKPSAGIQLELSKADLELPVSASTYQAKREEPKSPDKLKSILNYLDDVETSCDKTLLETRRSIPESNRSEIEFVVEPDIAEDVPKISDLLMLPNHQLARRIVALTLRSNELSNAVQLSKEHVTQIRNEKEKGLRVEKQNGGNRLREQKKHYEGIVMRHQGFIEQLLKDKGSLCEKIAALTRRLESQNQAWEHKIDAEVVRVKEATLAGEKIRRERWVKENTKKIKELTVKGLEAEINRMNSVHQQEITDLKREHQQHLLTALDEARQKHEHAENLIRELCAKDRESIIEKERSAIRERFDRQLEEERMLFEEKKNKILKECGAEKERLLMDIRKKDQALLVQKEDLSRDRESCLEQVQAEFHEKIAKQEEKYQNRINAIEKQYESDFAIWKRDFEHTFKLREVEHENTIRQHYRTERDRQIDAIVSRMDMESQKAQDDFELKMSRLKEKHESDLRESEAAERAARDKYNEARSRLAESDAQVKNFEAEMKQMQIELEHSKKMCNEFLSEKEHIKEKARNDVQLEMANLKTERDNEIQRIYKRVQQAIEKKDATIELLQKETGSLRERCIKLEAIIRQQRKDYCAK